MKLVMKNLSGVTLLAVLILLTGCAGKTPVAPEPDRAMNCHDVLNAGIDMYSDVQLAQAFEQTQASDADDCWLALMRESLAGGRSIPEAHLVRALEELNNYGDEELFHDAAQAYLAQLSETGGYGTEQRAFLSEYCSLVIHGAGSRHDEILERTRLTCRRLDRDLYHNYFD